MRTLKLAVTAFAFCFLWAYFLKPKWLTTLIIA